jgi:micrococcal nuclease
MRLTCFLCVLYFSWMAPAFPQEILLGYVVNVIDGDTVDLQINAALQRIRLAEIDAPEKNQLWGSESREALEKKILDRSVRVVVTDVDRYGRNIGTIFFGKTSINQVMVLEGHAWVYRHYSNDQELIDLEEMARTDKVGLWSRTNPMPPWQWRSQQRSN